MKKIKIYLCLVGCLIITLIFFTPIAYADVIIPPCGPGQTPAHDFCSITNQNSNRNYPHNTNRQDNLLIYEISGGVIIIIGVISVITLLIIKRKNGK